jgi:hypothetical protein
MVIQFWLACRPDAPQRLPGPILQQPSPWQALVLVAAAAAHGGNEGALHTLPVTSHTDTPLQCYGNTFHGKAWAQHPLAETKACLQGSCTSLVPCQA